MRRRENPCICEGLTRVCLDNLGNLGKARRVSYVMAATPSPVMSVRMLKGQSISLRLHSNCPLVRDVKLLR